MPRYGQHFLANQHAVERIVEALEISPQDDVLEIGPGKGALTTYLVRRARLVVAVEVDAEMIGILKNKLTTAKNFRLIEGDILDVEAEKLQAHSEGRPFKVVGNLPYNLTSPILRWLSNWSGWSSAHFMVQKEVGERLCAKVGDQEYGALSAGMALTCQAKKVFVLSETSFRPPPKVKSMVVKITRRSDPLTTDIDGAQRIIQAAFQQRRKTIVNSLSHGLHLTKEQVAAALAEVKVAETARAENVSVEQFVQLSQRLSSPR